MNLTVKRLDLVRKVGIVQTKFWWFAAFFSGKVPLRGPTAHQTSNLMKGMDAFHGTDDASQAQAWTKAECLCTKLPIAQYL